SGKSGSPAPSRVPGPMVSERGRASGPLKWSSDHMTSHSSIRDRSVQQMRLKIRWHDQLSCAAMATGAESAGLVLKRAPRQKLAETVAQQLLEAIKDLPPGTRVPPERELTKELGVGRSTVREALNGLALM